ncbi:MAG: HypC/HybG/HupF family hydrogenase formation chaperone [bacterium]
MCLATIGKIKKIKENNLAEADFDGVRYDINIELVDVKKNDYVMVHAGFAIQKVLTKDVKEIKKLN